MAGIPPNIIRKSREKNAAHPLRRRVLILFLVLAIIATIGAFAYPGWKAQAQAGVAYGSRVGCSCLYVQGRSVKSCESDFLPGMEMVSLSADKEAKTATAQVRFLARRTARFSGTSGCIVDPVE